MAHYEQGTRTPPFPPHDVAGKQEYLIVLKPSEGTVIHGNDLQSLMLSALHEFEALI